MNPGRHLSADELAAWRERRLNPEQIAAVAGHLSACEQCRKALTAPHDESRLAEALNGPRHLGYEDLEDLVRGRCAADRRAELNRHLAICQMCSDDLRDLETFETDLRSSRRPARRHWLGWIGVAATAAAAAVGFFAANRTVAPPKPAEPTPTAKTVASLEDSGRAIRLDESGKVHGLDGAGRELEELVRIALKTGQLPQQTAARNLAYPREVLLGAQSNIPALSLSGPAGTVVLNRQPRFRWSAPPEASRFIVSVYSVGFENIVTSPELKTTEWTSTRALEDGQTYIWTVSALIGGERVTAPRSPEPEARFRIANDSARSEFGAAVRLRPPSDFAMAIVAEKLGLVPEASDALARLSTANPDSPLVTSLRQSLSAQAQPKK